MKNELIVFYDGECGFCNRSVAFVLKNDKTKSIRFAALQSDFTKKLFNENDWSAPDLSTFYFLENGMLHQKSTAALKLTAYFGFPRSMFKVFVLVPRFIRDGVYDFIAKNRRRIAKGYCVVPAQEDRERFIG